GRRPREASTRATHSTEAHLGTRWPDPCPDAGPTLAWFMGVEEEGIAPGAAALPVDALHPYVRRRARPAIHACHVLPDVEGRRGNGCPSLTTGDRLAIDRKLVARAVAKGVDDGAGRRFYLQQQTLWLWVH